MACACVGYYKAACERTIARRKTQLNRNFVVAVKTSRLKEKNPMITHLLLP